ncbi:Neuromedin-K receptor [Trichoplax sp. H2]|nr:Neuromedin-K receptor [Trichoplax sp. H2]|eukprot:RDD36782.1 Neuromedin-K receptor [Trichoplax sp. H2]
MNNTSLIVFLPTKQLRIIYLSACLILLPILSIGIVGNLLLVNTIVKHKKFHTPSYYLSANMAISDVMLLACSIIYLSLNALLAMEVEMEAINMKLACQINAFIIGSSYLTSSQTFAVISIDRYIIMNNNYFNHYSPFRSKVVLYLIIASIWTIALILSLRLYLTVDIHPRFPYLCDIKPVDDQNNYSMSVYHIVAAVVSYPIPLLIVVILYLKIIYRMRSSYGSNPAVFSNRRYHHQINATKMMIMATSLFMINALLLFLIWITVAITRKSLAELIIAYGRPFVMPIAVSLFLATLTGVQNPIIYFSYNKGFRLALKMYLIDSAACR